MQSMRATRTVWAAAAARFQPTASCTALRTTAALHSLTRPLPLAAAAAPARCISSSPAAASRSSATSHAAHGPLALTSLEFPYLKADPASPSTAGLDYARGTSVRDAPLLVLHGLLGSAINWRTTAPKLTQRRRVVSVDVRNHGGSPHVGAMDFASCAADVIALMDSKGIDRAVILGHSLGGKIAMAAALLYPQRITAVISVDMAPIQYMVASAGWSGVGRIVAACAAVPLKDMRSRAQVDAFLKPLIPDFTTRAFVMQNIVVTTHEPTAEEIAAGADPTHKTQTVSWRCNLEVLAASLPRMAEFDLGLPGGATPARFEGPSLFVAGGRSTYLLPAHEAAIEALFHRHQMVSIPDAGHWVHVERPKEFVDIVQPWLQKLEQLEEPTQPRVA